MSVARTAAFVLAIALATALPASSQIGPPRLLEGFEIVRGDGAWEIEVRFSTPIRYLRHSPHRRGASLQIQIAPISVSPVDAPLLAYEQSFPAPAGAPIPLETVAYEGLHGSARFVVLRFARAVSYAVRPGADFRSLVVSIPDAATPPRPPAPTTEAQAAPSAPPAQPATPPAKPPADWAAQSEALLASGRSALESGDADGAIRAFTKVLSFPEHPGSAVAKEWLGVARERRGQLAHAKAEYQEFLDRYPEGEAAARVRQRLDALVTAQTKLPPRRTAAGASAAAAPLDLDVLGSLYSQYRYEHRDFEFGSLVADSSIWSDATVVTRLRTEDWAFRSQASGSQLFQLVDTGGGNETRVSSLFLEARQNEGTWRGMLGRQSGTTGGSTAASTGCARAAASPSTGASASSAVRRSSTSARTR